MLDLSKYSGKPEYAELVEEIKALRAAGSTLADVCEIVAAETEPIHPDCVKCEQVARGEAKTALTAWRNLERRHRQDYRDTHPIWRRQHRPELYCSGIFGSRI